MVDPITTIPPSLPPLALQNETLHMLAAQPAPDAGAARLRAPILSDSGCVLDQRG